ncbi:MAG: caspase family protein [Symploca sp. SIO2E6]|nr:caspase family protein [Symploca sp. SIO2E6]
MSTNHHNLAVLVGINAYENGIPGLKTPINDVAGLAEVLQCSYQYDVKLILDSQATLAGLNRLLDDFQHGILTLSDQQVVREHPILEKTSAKERHGKGFSPIK